MLTTEHRPVPLPNQGAAEPVAQLPRRQARRTLPKGATHWSRSYFDEAGKQRTAKTSVPVSESGELAAHEYDCPECPDDPPQWLPINLKTIPYCPVHGIPLSRTDERRRLRIDVPWRAIWDVLDERIRVTAATVLVGAAAVAVDQAPMPWVGVAAQMTAIPVVIAGSWWATRWWLTRQAVKRGKLNPLDEVAGKRRRRLIAKRSRMVGYTAAAAALWVQMADLVGVDFTDPRGPVLAAALAGMGIVASRPYLRYVDEKRGQRAEIVTMDPSVIPLQEPTDPGADAARRWLEHTPNGAVLNTRLVADSYRTVVGGWGILIRATVPGAIDVDLMTDASSKGKLRIIAGTFGVKKSAIQFVEDDDPNSVLMLVQPNPPLAEGQLWEGPDSIDVGKGVATTGRYLDGAAMVEPFYRWRWGAPPKIVLGTTGSGKSENLRKQMVIERWFAHRDQSGQMRGLFATFLHDPKNFESFGEYRRAIHAAGSTREDAIIMRDALIRETHRRYAMLSSLQWRDSKGRDREGGVKWDPRIHGPILSWIIDEFHVLAKDATFIGPLETMARMMRACGIRLTIGTHLATLGDTGSRGLRDMLAGGYALLGRTTDALTTVITGGQLTADPRTLPKLPGMCLVADGETATMHARQSYIPDDEDAERLNVRSVYDWLFDDDNQPIGYPAVLPQETLAAFGPEWVRWAEAGRQPGGRGAWTPTSASAAPADSGDAGRAKDAVLRVLWAANAPLDIDGMDDALADFRARGGRCSTSMARKVLKELVDEGVAHKPKLPGKAGWYALTDAAREDLDARMAESGQAAGT